MPSALATRQSSHPMAHHLYQQYSQQTYLPSNPSSAHSSPQTYPSELDFYPSSHTMNQGYMPTANPYPPSRQPKNASYSLLQVQTTSSTSSADDQDACEPTARPSNAHVHAQFHSQPVPLPPQIEASNSGDSTSSSATDNSVYQPGSESIPNNYAKTTPGLSRGLSRPLSRDEEDRLAVLDKLKYFLATAPSRWDPAAVGTSGVGNSMDTLSLSLAGHSQSSHLQPPAHPALNRFLLPSQEYATCVLWNGLYHITGTDIVRALVFRFEAFGRPVRNMKKFEEGVFSDLRNLKPGHDASLEEPKSPFLDLLFKYQCIRTQKKQKVFYWFSVPHDRLFLDALERDLKREKMGQEPTTQIVGEPAQSFTYDPKRTLYEQFSKAAGKNDGEGEFEATVRLAIEGSGASPDGGLSDVSNGSVAGDESESEVDESRRDSDSKRASSITGATPVLNMFTFFEGSPSYKQRRKKITKMGSSLGGQSITRDDLEGMRGRYPERRYNASVSDSRERSFGLTPGFGAYDGAHASGEKINAADMFLRQARGELDPADGSERKIRPQGSVGEVGVYYAEAAYGVQRTRSHDPSHRSSFPNSVQPPVSADYTTPSFGAVQGHSSYDSADMVKFKVFQCPLFSCGRMFKRMEHLKRHLRTHTSERPFICSHCAKRFSRSDNLAQHVRTHTNGRFDAHNTSVGSRQDGGRWDGNAMDADMSHEAMAGLADGEDLDDDEFLNTYAQGLYASQNGDNLGLGVPRSGFNGIAGGYTGANLDVQMCEIEVQGDLREVHGDEEGLLMRNNDPAVLAMSNAYYPAASTAVSGFAPTGAEYVDATGDWAMRTQPSPAFNVNNHPSPPGPIPVSTSNRSSINGPPVGYVRPSVSPQSNSSSSSVYGDDYAATMSAPSHKEAFDHAAMYPAGMLESAAGSAVRRHRSMTPSVVRDGGPIRRSITASGDYSHLVNGGSSNRAYHPYAYGSGSHSRASSTTSSPAVYPVPLSGEYPPHPRRSESRNSSLGTALQEQMMMNMSLSGSASAASGTMYGTHHANGSASSVYGDEVYRTDSPASFASQNASPAPYTSELPIQYPSDGFEQSHAHIAALQQQQQHQQQYAREMEGIYY